MTLMELEHVSDTTDEQKPMTALRESFFTVVSCFGIFSCRKLYVRNLARPPKKKKKWSQQR